MDPLSDVLSLLKPRGLMFRGLDAGAPWSLRFPPSEGINCYALLSGECWLVVEGVPDAVRVTVGDCVLLPKGRSFRLASDTDLPPIDAVAFISSALEGGVATLNGGGDCFGMEAISALTASTPKFCWGCCRRSFISSESPTRRRCAGVSIG